MRLEEVESADPWAPEIEYFVACLEQNRSPERGTGEQARQALAVSLAANESLRDGHAVQELIRDIAVDRISSVVNTFLYVNSCLEDMRAGHVRGDEALVVAIAVLGAAVRHIGAERGIRVVSKTRRLLQDGYVVLGHAGLPEIRPVRQHQRCSGFEQEPVGHRRAPGHLKQALRPEMPSRDRFNGVRRSPGIDNVVLKVHEERHLVFLGRLPRQTQRVRPVALVPVCGPCQVWRVEGCALRLVEEQVCQLIPIAPFSMRCEKPQPVLPDGTAQRRRGIIEVENLVHRVEPA